MGLRDDKDFKHLFKLIFYIKCVVHKILKFYYTQWILVMNLKI